MIWLKQMEIKKVENFFDLLRTLHLGLWRIVLEVRHINNVIRS